MNELIQQLKSRVGLDDDKAHSAAQTAIDFLKQRLPGPIAAQIDKVLGGGSAESAMKDLEGFFGKKTA